MFGRRFEVSLPHAEPTADAAEAYAITVADRITSRAAVRDIECNFEILDIRNNEVACAVVVNPCEWYAADNEYDRNEFYFFLIGAFWGIMHTEIREVRTDG